MSTPYNRIKELLTRLEERTAGGVASWSSGTRDDTFLFNGSNASVALSTKDNDGIPPYVVTLYDDAGRPVETYQAAYDADFEDDEPSDWYKLVDRLYQGARRNALKIDDVIASLEQDLEDEAPKARPRKQAAEMDVDDIPF